MTEKSIKVFLCRKAVINGGDGLVEKALELVLLQIAHEDFHALKEK